MNENTSSYAQQQLTKRKLGTGPAHVHIGRTLLETTKLPKQKHSSKLFSTLEFSKLNKQRFKFWKILDRKVLKNSHWGDIIESSFRFHFNRKSIYFHSRKTDKTMNPLFGDGPRVYSQTVRWRVSVKFPSIQSTFPSRIDAQKECVWKSIFCISAFPFWGIQLNLNRLVSCL